MPESSVLQFAPWNAPFDFTVCSCCFPQLLLQISAQCPAILAFLLGPMSVSKDLGPKALDNQFIWVIISVSMVDSPQDSTCWWMKAEESLKYVLNLCWVALNLVWKYPYTLHSDKCHLRSGFMAFPVVIICTLRPGKPFLFYNFHCLPGKRKRISCPKALWRNANNFLA